MVSGIGTYFHDDLMRIVEDFRVCIIGVKVTFDFESTLYIDHHPK